MKPLHSMNQEEIVKEIGEIRSSMEAHVARLAALSQVLYSQSRRDASDGRPVYVAYSNAWGRFAGAVHQGLRRVGSADRLVSNFKKQAEEKKEAAADRARKEAKSLEKSRSAAFGDYEELYGEELIASLQDEVG